jgi:hypothetical protein
LGREVLGPEKTLPDVAPPSRQEHVALQSLWQQRWPAIALQECVDKVTAAPPTERRQVARDLPCAECPMNTGCLNAKKKELGPLLYAREILTKPRSQESTLFPFELFRPMLDTSLAQVPMYQKPEQQADDLLVVSGWDLAWSEKVGGDRLVRVTAVHDLRRRRKRLLNVQRYPAGLRYTEQCELIKAEHRRFNEDLVVIESDAAQIIWAQHLEQSSDVPVFRHTAGEKQHLQIGVPGLLIDFDNERWEFPYADGSFQFGEMENMLAEFEAFGWADGKLEGVGEHDDVVMAFWHCSHGLKVLSGTIDEFRSGLQEGRTD